MGTVLQDIRYACRRMAKSPRHAVLVAFVLALGIGPNVFLFSMLRATLFHPLPFPEWKELVTVHPVMNPSMVTLADPANVEAWAGERAIFSSLAALRVKGVNLTSLAEPRRALAVEVSTAFWSLLRARPALGRFFSTTGAAESDEAVISYPLWQDAFHGDPKIIGSQIIVSDQAYTVVGVTMPGFDPNALLYSGADRTDLWLPLRFTPRDAGNKILPTIARLQPGVSRSAAAARLSSLISKQDRSNGESSVRVLGLRQEAVAGARPALAMLTSAVVFLLLLTCANAANLLLARGEARRREIAIRQAVGASRGRLLRQLLTEVFILAAAGAAGGLLVAHWAIKVTAQLLPHDFPILAQPQLDVPALLAALGVTLISAIIAGIAPALALSNPKGTIAISASAPEFFLPLAGEKIRLRSALVVIEVALAITLAVGATLTLNGFKRVLNAPAGFDAGEVQRTRIGLPGSRYPKDDDRARFVHRLLLRLDETHIDFAVSDGRPGVNTGWSAVFSVRGPLPADAVGANAPAQSVSGGYFACMGIPMLAGRAFGLEDQMRSPPVAVVDTRLAKLLGPGSALGKLVYLAGEAEGRRVVGVVGSVHLYGVPDDVSPQIYIPITQFPSPSFALLARSKRSGLELTRMVRQALKDVDAGQTIAPFTPLANDIGAQLAVPTLDAALATAFGALALLLAALGVYGLSSNMVSSRLHEFAVRMCVGATPRSLVRLLFSDVGKLLALGAVAGAGGIAFLILFVAPSLPVSAMPGAGPLLHASDPPGIAAGVFFFLGAGSAAALLPALRLGRIDPASLLRLG